MATFKHISSKNADYGAAEQYLTFEHDEFTMKPTLDKNGRLVLRDDYRISSLNCGDEDFAIACMRSNLKYGKNQKREDAERGVPFRFCAGKHHALQQRVHRDAEPGGNGRAQAGKAFEHLERADGLYHQCGCGERPDQVWQLPGAFCQSVPEEYKAV